MTDRGHGIVALRVRVNLSNRHWYKPAIKMMLRLTNRLWIHFNNGRIRLPR